MEPNQDLPEQSPALPEGISSNDYMIGQAIQGILASKERNLFNLIDNVDNITIHIVLAARRIAAEVILQQETNYEPNTTSLRQIQKDRQGLK